MNGLELCRRIREQDRDRYTYIIILTAKGEKEDLVHVFEAGADDYIAKPFEPEELQSRLHNGLRILDLEQRHVELQGVLTHSRNKFRTILDSLEEGIIAVDRQNRIVSANQAFIEASRTDYDKVIGQSCCGGADGRSTGEPPMVSSLVPRRLSEAFETGRPSRDVETATDENGRPRYTSISCIPVRAADNDMDTVLVVMKDITEDRIKTRQIEDLNRHMEVKNKELGQALLQLENSQAQMIQSEKMASIGQLAAGVAHEINNPTGFISSNMKTLGEYQKDMDAILAAHRQVVQAFGTGGDAPAGPDEIRALIKTARDLEEELDVEFLQEDMRELIEDCREGTERIKKIVLDLKDFAHPGEDSPIPADINSSLKSTLNVVNNELKYKAKVFTEFGELPQITCLPQKLNQVFMNLLVNAAQAIENQGEIRVSTSRVNGHIEVAISDTGCGIAEENLNRIFDPFFTTKEVGKGTGLGMHIVYNIIQKHNGSIDVTSKLGEGTTFTIRLPVDNTFTDGSGEAGGEGRKTA